MKRSTVVAVAVLVTALMTINLTSAQKKGGQGVKKTEKKMTGELLKDPTIPYDTSKHTAWDSGELQKQIGSKNKDKKKIIMRVWCDYGHDSPTTYWWEVRYSLRAENKDLTGSGWHEVADLYALTYNFTYNIGGGSPTSKSGNKPLGGSSKVDSELIAGGANASATPTFTLNMFTGKRGGGSSGIDLDWP